MSIGKLSSIFVLATLLISLVVAHAQTTEGPARDLAQRVVRSQLHLRPDQFLGVQRDEELEQSLAIASVGWRAGSQFIYRVSATGVEIKDNAIVRHVATDADLMYIIAICSKDGSTFRIHGFPDSLAEFNKLMTNSQMKVSTPEQAEFLVNFYREVNPENVPLTPISSLIDLKQAGERQCQSRAKSFGAGQNAFAAWWNRAKFVYSKLLFQQKAVPHGSGYMVKWVVLSSASAENCGGSPLGMKLEVGTDGHVGKLTAQAVQRSPRGRVAQP